MNNFPWHHLQLILALRYISLVTCRYCAFVWLLNVSIPSYWIKRVMLICIISCRGLFDLRHNVPVIEGARWFVQILSPRQPLLATNFSMYSISDKATYGIVDLCTSAMRQNLLVTYTFCTNIYRWQKTYLSAICILIKIVFAGRRVVIWHNKLLR